MSVLMGFVAWTLAMVLIIMWAWDKWEDGPPRGPFE